MDHEVLFRQWSGKKFTDVVTTTYPPLVLVSDRFVASLREGGITGWQTFGSRLVNKRGEPITGYQGLTIIGRCGGVSDADSVLVHKLNEKMKDGSYPVLKGLAFDVDSWDGSDFFVPQSYNGGLTSAVILSRRAKELIEKCSLTNVEAISLQEYEMPFIPPMKG